MRYFLTDLLQQFVFVNNVHGRVGQLPAFAGKIGLQLFVLYRYDLLLVDNCFLTQKFFFFLLQK